MGTEAGNGKKKAYCSAITETCRDQEEIVRRAETEPEKRDKKANTELRLVKEKFRMGSKIEKVRV
jgi:hypothetical protein